MQKLNLQTIHPSWQPIVETALAQVDSHYIQELEQNPNWLPGARHIFNAFSIPLDKTHYILFGESPYPRAESANGYAFWDAKVHEIWSPDGLTKPVNRATSLRNIMKMLLIGEGLLTEADTSQAAIAKVDKTHLVQSLDELFENLQQQGFLLLNASLALLGGYKVQYHAKKWHVFMESILTSLHKTKPDVQLVLLGNIAKIIEKMPIANHFSKIVAEHPYNVSFITNSKVLNFFNSFHLLKKNTITYVRINKRYQDENISS